MPGSCLFLYQKRAWRFDESTNKPEPVFDKDGKQHMNDNWLNFNQVISCYWEVIEETEPFTQQLNIFMTGGSVSRDHKTGETQMKSGYTITLPEFLGRKFINQFYNWSLGPASPPPQRNEDRNEVRRSPRTSANRAVKVEEFGDPEAELIPATWEPLPE